MRVCEQSKNQSVLHHGFSVRNYTFDLINHLRLGTTLKYSWILPDWIYENSELILKSLPSDRTLKYYTILHDCGKPYCLNVDKNGKRHFTNHAEVSYNIFNQLFDDSIASHLIKHDMDIHLLKADGVENFCENPYALTLLLVGLVEIHSNAQMFGGFSSESFLIKKKQIFKRGKSIINFIKNENKKNIIL